MDPSQSCYDVSVFRSDQHTVADFRTINPVLRRKPDHAILCAFAIHPNPQLGIVPTKARQPTLEEVGIEVSIPQGNHLHSPRLIRLRHAVFSLDRIVRIFRLGLHRIRPGQRSARILLGLLFLGGGKGGFSSAEQQRSGNEEAKSGFHAGHRSKSIPLEKQKRTIPDHHPVAGLQTEQPHRPKVSRRKQTHTQRGRIRRGWKMRC